jgi:hypothetical protein
MLRAQVLDAIARGLSESGFEARPAEQAFRKTMPFGSWTLHISFVPHESELDLTADVAVRIDEVEDLVNASDAGMTAVDKKRTATLGAELGNLADGRQKRWTLARSQDVGSVAAQVVAECREFGLPYLEQYSEPTAILDALSRNDPSGWRHSPIHGARCIRAVALALVLHDRKEAKEVADKCDAFLSQRRDPGLQEFRSTAQRILALT